jgi:hypothetical protein
MNLYEKYESPPIPTFPPMGERSRTDLIKKFYFDLSKKLQIPELHLDALVWVNYDDLIN